MIRWFVAVFVLAVWATACTENLTTPGACPTFCPGGQAQFRDTTLSPVPGGDSSFSGYVSSSNQVSMLVSNGGDYGQTRAVIRFTQRGDSVLVADTNRSFRVDSVIIELGVQALDTTASNIFFDVYRLPLSVDSSVTLDALDSMMTPDKLLGEYAAAQTFRTGTFDLALSGSDLNKLAFAPLDTTQLEIGVRIRADGPVGARIGTAVAGSLEPAFATWVTADSVTDTTINRVSISRVPSKTFTVRSPGPPPPADLLAVGGDPVSRAFLRFALPTYLRDSATIIRATLNCTSRAPLFGIPADTADMLALPVLADFGPKSPVSVATFAASVPAPGRFGRPAWRSRRWWSCGRGARRCPSIVRLSMAAEGGNVPGAAVLLDAVERVPTDAADHVPSAVRLPGVVVTRRAGVLVILTLVVGAGRAGAQSSEFGVRGLGLPGRSASAHSLGLEGSNSFFDAESSDNPASLIGLSIATAPSRR